MSQPDEFQREVGDSERYWGKVLATAEGQGIYRFSQVVQTILEYLPDVIGVQEPKRNQREFMADRLNMFYDYYGKPRDLRND